MRPRPLARPPNQPTFLDILVRPDSGTAGPVPLATLINAGDGDRLRGAGSGSRVRQEHPQAYELGSGTSHRATARVFETRGMRAAQRLDTGRSRKPHSPGILAGHVPGSGPGAPGFSRGPRVVPATRLPVHGAVTRTGPGGSRRPGCSHAALGAGTSGDVFSDSRVELPGTAAAPVIRPAAAAGTCRPRRSEAGRPPAPGGADIPSAESSRPPTGG